MRPRLNSPIQLALVWACATCGKGGLALVLAATMMSTVGAATQELREHPDCRATLVTMERTLERAFGLNLSTEGTPDHLRLRAIEQFLVFLKGAADLDPEDLLLKRGPGKSGRINLRTELENYRSLGCRTRAAPANQEAGQRIPPRETYAAAVETRRLKTVLPIRPEELLAPTGRIERSPDPLPRTIAVHFPKLPAQVVFPPHPRRFTLEASTGRLPPLPEKAAIASRQALPPALTAGRRRALKPSTKRRVRRKASLRRQGRSTTGHSPIMIEDYLDPRPVLRPLPVQSARPIGARPGRPR